MPLCACPRLGAVKSLPAPGSAPAICNPAGPANVRSLGVKNVLLRYGEMTAGSGKRSFMSSCQMSGRYCRKVGQACHDNISFSLEMHPADSTRVVQTGRNVKGAWRAAGFAWGSDCGSYLQFGHFLKQFGWWVPSERGTFLSSWVF